jgi:uncharacterized C2H2 Zn-finger protein
METNLSQIYSCDYCNISTRNKKDYIKHTLTAKHKRLTSINTMETECTPINILKCDKCFKAYKSRVGLWKHNKKCVILINEITDITNITDITDKQ